MLYFCNGFSESMKRDPNMKEIPYPMTVEEFVDIVHHADFTSVIGHDDLARCLSKITGKKIKYNRRGIQVNYDDLVLVVSLSGRLPENPSYVEYKGRLNFSLKRFEKQTQADMLTSIQKIEEIKEMI